MEGEPFVDRPPASERPVPAGAARVAPFASAAEHADALFELVTLRLAAALLERRELGLLDEAREAAARRLLARIEHASVAGQGELSAAIARRAAVQGARLEASRALGIELPLADALDAWRLSSADRAILATLLGAACAPAIAQLLRCAGPTLEGVAAMLGPGHEGVLAAEARLAAGAPLIRLGLVTVRGAGRPLLARELVPAPRLTALARGALELDPALRGAALQRDRDPLVAGWTTASAYSRLRGALARGTPLPVTWLAARRGCGAAAIAADAALSLARRALHVRTPDAGPAWLDALAREALLHRAAIVAWHDGRPLEPLLRRFERLPIPLVVIDEGAAGDAPPPPLPLLRIELPLPSAADRETLWRRSLGTLEQACDLGELAAALRVGAEAIDRAVAHAAHVAAAGERPIAPADLVGGLHAQLPGPLGPFVPPGRRGAPVLAGERLDRARAFELAARERHAALAVVTGPAGSGKTALAGRLAHDLGLPFVELDAGAEPAALEAALIAAEQGLCLLGIDRADQLPAARLRRLERARGAVVAMARGPVGLAGTVALALA